MQDAQAQLDAFQGQLAAKDAAVHELEATLLESHGMVVSLRKQLAEERDRQAAQGAAPAVVDTQVRGGEEACGGGLVEQLAAPGAAGGGHLCGQAQALSVDCGVTCVSK